jgi:hypothetical protein
MLTGAEANNYISGFVLTMVAIVVVVNLIPTLLSSVTNVTGVPILTAGLIGMIVGAGVIVFIVKAFF